MQLGLMAALASLAVLGGCASAQGMGHGPMGQGAMNHEEMMRHCQMMQEHHGDGSAAPADYDPAQHGGMSHEEMMRHCAEMRAGEGSPQQQH
jgi:hypothetical protein